jgi:hypothetical protein
VLVRVLPVDAAAAVVGVDLTRVLLEGIGPVRQPARPDPAEDLVELLLGDEERVVPGRHHGVVEEVQRDLVGQLDDGERAEVHRWRQPEELGQEGGRGVPVVRGDDGVVELDGHGGLPPCGGGSEARSRTAREPLCSIA